MVLTFCTSMSEIVSLRVCASWRQEFEVVKVKNNLKVILTCKCLINVTLGALFLVISTFWWSLMAQLFVLSCGSLLIHSTHSLSPNISRSNISALSPLSTTEFYRMITNFACSPPIPLISCYILLREFHELMLCRNM